MNTQPDPETGDMPDPVPDPMAAPEAQPGTETEPQDRVSALEAEVGELKDRLLRAMAETENLRKRTAREKEDTGKYAIARFAGDLLSVADNLRRAVDAVGPDRAELPEPVTSLLAGVEGTERELLTVLERHGVTPVNPDAGVTFDPNFHEAMFEVETGEVPAGGIVQVLQVGYMIRDRLLRPARVGVAKAPAGGAHQVDVEA